MQKRREEGPISHPLPPPRQSTQGPPHPPQLSGCSQLLQEKGEMDNILSSHHQPPRVYKQAHSLCVEPAASGSFSPQPSHQPLPLVGFLLRTNCALDFGILRYFLELPRQDSELKSSDQFPSCSGQNRVKDNSPSRPSSWLRGPS